jgi:hypothetical protein
MLHHQKTQIPIVKCDMASNATHQRSWAPARPWESRAACLHRSLIPDVQDDVVVTASQKANDESESEARET